MTLRFYNSLTRQIEDFVPLEPGKVSMYSCGPTVYSYVHIGNLRAQSFFDLLRRYLRYRGYELKHAMNLTDVDDKIIRASQKEGKSLKELTQFYADALFEDLHAMNMQIPEIIPRATEEIERMVDMIKVLLEKDYAYKTEKGDIYYKVSAFKDYGKLAQLDSVLLKKNAAGRLNRSDEYEKEEVNDFALWKAYDLEDGEVYWETEIGKGRPGWHIECSAMATKYLGDTFDLHIGGIDLLFPHHTNEIAQSEAATGKQFARYWMHNAHLIVEGKKMSKSLGNFYTLKDLLEKGHDPKAIRFEFIKTHYRQVLDFREEHINQSGQIVSKFNDFLQRLNEASGEGSTADISSLAKRAQEGFQYSMDDDLNIASALAVIYDFMNSVNKEMKHLNKQQAQIVLDVMQGFDSVLGVMKFEKEDLPEEAMTLIEQREQARKDKNWAESDRLRDELLALGIVIEDTPQGVRWKKS